MNKSGPILASALRAVACVALIGLFTLPVARAIDLGVQGTVWPIVEVDIREMLMKQLAVQDFNKIQQHMKDSAGSYLDHLPSRATSTVSSTQTRWYDPSFTLTSDIWAPVQNAAGEYSWGILYPKGTRVNPLERQRPYNAMLFFDGSSKEQIDFVAAAVAKFPGKILPIEATGANPEKLSEKLKFPVYTVTNAMAAKFDLTRTPSLLYPGDKEHRLELGYTTYGAPYSLAELGATWPEGFKTSPGARR